jgi:uroporphyrinogen-III synthase
LEIFKIENTQKYFEDHAIAAIGPTTKEAIENSGVKVDIVPVNFTMDDLINSIINYYSKTEKII